MKKILLSIILLGGSSTLLQGATQRTAQLSPYNPFQEQALNFIFTERVQNSKQILRDAFFFFANSKRSILLLGSSDALQHYSEWFYRGNWTQVDNGYRSIPDSGDFIKFRVAIDKMLPETIPAVDSEKARLERITRDYTLYLMGFNGYFNDIYYYRTQGYTALIEGLTSLQQHLLDGGGFDSLHVKSESFVTTNITSDTDTTDHWILAGSKEVGNTQGLGIWFRDKLKTVEAMEVAITELEHIRPSAPAQVRRGSQQSAGVASSQVRRGSKSKAVAPGQQPRRGSKQLPPVLARRASQLASAVAPQSPQRRASVFSTDSRRSSRQGSVLLPQAPSLYGEEDDGNGDDGNDGDDD